MKYKLPHIGYPTGIIFRWFLPNTSTEDMRGMRILFKISLGSLTGFYWQSFLDGSAELKWLSPNRTYDVEVKLGPESFATWTLWPTLQLDSAYAIRTGNNGYLICLITLMQSFCCCWNTFFKCDKAICLVLYWVNICTAFDCIWEMISRSFYFSGKRCIRAFWKLFFNEMEKWTSSIECYQVADTPVNSF